jgi:tetratricopeptide (TPR) repeat protein
MNIKAIDKIARWYYYTARQENGMHHFRNLLFFLMVLFFLSCTRKADDISLAYILADDYLIYSLDSGYPSKIDEAKYHYSQELEFYNKQDYKMAVDNFIMACRDFTFRIVYYQLGLCLMDTGDYENAKKSLIKSINLSIDEYTHDLFTYDDNDSPREIYFAYYNIACIEALQNNFTVSYDYLSKAVFYGYPYSEYMKKDTDLKNLFTHENGFFLKAIEEKINNRRYNDETDFDYEIKEDGETVAVIGVKRIHRGGPPGPSDPPMENGRTVTIHGYHGIRKDINIPPAIKNIPVTVIEEEAFYNENLTSVIIPSSIIFIGRNAFANNKIMDVILPKSVKTIYPGTFTDNQITDLYIPYGVTQIINSAFMNNQLTTVTIPNSIFNIGPDVFKNNQLKNILIPPSVRYITEGAFMDNPLSSVTIGANVQLLGQFYKGFDHCYYSHSKQAAGIYTYNKGKWRVR